MSSMALTGTSLSSRAGRPRGPAKPVPTASASASTAPTATGSSAASPAWKRTSLGRPPQSRSWMEPRRAASGAPETRTDRIGNSIHRTDGRGPLSRITRVDADVAGPTTAIPELDGSPAGELVIVNDDDLSYAFIELDADSQKAATENITA